MFASCLAVFTALPALCSVFSLLFLLLFAAGREEAIAFDADDAVAVAAAASAA